ncbi:hypothetical protein METHB2_1100003 [Candidatus Methylobacter favarea]|uniref:Uncharacterized protein n=1 Tax=Candidatus Methylobacter favarea TaxID=2707345 RepID=A0A8S0XHD3_9GAMM|nr:hypothetical protein METHB2_1100003 [Candidatus Methylobacter favarea]
MGDMEICQKIDNMLKQAEMIANELAA